MSGARAALLAHLQGGAATVCRAWGLERADGVRLGFTDHDRDLAFDGWAFRADTGMSASALMQTTGLSVDNVEGLGALSDAAVSEADIAAGRYDGAAVTCWLVNWRDVAERMLLFRGEIGEIARAGGAFRADLRGAAEALNRPRARVYQRTCGAVLGDAACGVDLSAPEFRAEVAVGAVAGARRFELPVLAAYAEEWFARGRLTVLSGAASGLTGQIRTDRAGDGARIVELWQELRAEVAPGDMVRLEAGCDKRLETCRDKFANTANFRGFPHIPGDDWVTSYPRRGDVNDGGSYLRLPGPGE